jgi:hypothetical protein
MHPLNRWVAGNDNIGVVAESLQAAIPNVTMNVIIGACGKPKKFNVPHGSQDQPEHDDTLRKSKKKKKLTDREEVDDARDRQGGHEVWSTSVAEVS